MNTTPERRPRISGKVIPFQAQAGKQTSPDLINWHAERAIIGAVLRNPDCFPVLHDMLQAGDFAGLFNGYVWWAFETIANRSGTIDPVTIITELDSSSCPVKGDALHIELAKFHGCAPLGSDPTDYARLILHAATRIRTMEAADRIKVLAADNSISLDTLRNECNTLIFEATDQRILRPSGMESLVSEYRARQDKLLSGEQSAGVLSGFKDLDALLHGFHPGEITVLAGAEKMGKTTLVLSMIRHIVKRGQRVVHFSTEMSQMEIIQLLLAQETGISRDFLRTGSLNDFQVKQCRDAMACMKTWPLDIVDEWTALTPGQIQRKLSALMRQQVVSLVTIDGLWMMHSHENGPAQLTREQRHSEVNTIMQQLAALAKPNGLFVPILLTHQLNYDAWKRGKVPRLDNLSESAGVRRMAQVVLILHRDSHYETESGDGGMDDTTYGYIRADRNGTAQGKRTTFVYDPKTNSYTGGGCDVLF